MTGAGEVDGQGRDAALALLAERVSQLAERVGELTARVETTEAGLRGQAQTVAEAASLAREVERLAGLVEQTAGGPGGAGPDRGGHPRVPVWAQMTDAESADALRDLAGWAGQVLVRRYPHAGLVLVPCWPAHPAAVEELDWLYWTWLEWATAGGEARARDAADWHDRWLPGVLARLGPELAQCSRAGHTRPQYPRSVPEALRDAQFAPEQMFVEQMRRARRADQAPAYQPGTVPGHRPGGF